MIGFDETIGLALLLFAAAYGAFYILRTSFVIDGKCTDADERRLMLSFLATDLQEELLRLEFDHVGIMSLAEAASGDRFDVALYAESVSVG